MDAQNLNIAYIGGGSRAWAWVFMADLAAEPALAGNIRLYDTDENGAAKNAAIGNRMTDQGAAGVWKYTVCGSLNEALKGADIVIISILPGTFKEMRVDVHLPERHQIYQSVGDTTGPGGIIRALRTVPIFAHFAAAIRENAPEAWVINYTNPMALCVRTLYHFFPEVKAFGCCHEVFGTQELLAQILRHKNIVKDAPRNDIHINVLGLNHFTWFSSASTQGLNLKGIYKEFAKEYYLTGFTPRSKPPMSHAEARDVDTVFTCSHRVKFDLFLKYGQIAAAGDRHLAEFMPAHEYLESPEAVRGWGFHLTPVSWREADLKARLRRGERILAGDETLPKEASGEEGVLLIKALCGLRRVVSNVNLPNTAGQIEDVPAETVVETNALFSYNEARPVMAGAFSPEIARLMAPHIANQQTTLTAAVTQDKELVYEAFARDPLVASRGLQRRELVALADDMLGATVDWE